MIPDDEAFRLLDVGQGYAGDEACLYCLSKTCAGDCDEAFADYEPDDGPPLVVDAPDISTWGQP